LTRSMKAAVIDVGYNSLKMVKYRVEPDGSAMAYGQLAMMARLGEGLESSGYLGREQISRTVEDLKVCREAAALDSIKHVILIGTSPVREAANAEEFLRRVQEETGMKMRVLTGNEEALYGFLGAARSVGTPTALYFDLGGGSLEMTYSEDYRIRRIQSLPLGALKLTSMHAGKDGRYSRKNKARMAKRISQLLPSRRELELRRDVVLVGTGGTVRALARFEQELTEYPLNKVHNYQIESESVQHMAREFFRVELDDLDRIPAIGEDRSETIAAGALVVRLLMKKLDFRRLKVSTHGLRDGILTEFLAQGVRPSSSIVQKEEIERLAAPPEMHPRVEGAAELAGCLRRNGVFDGRQESILLKALKRGRSPDCAEVDADALFGVLMSEDLPMSHDDQLFMAVSLVRARRSRTANWLLEKYGMLLSRDDHKAVKGMGACLRLLEVLDRSSAQFRVSYSSGLRISIRAMDEPFPRELVAMTAQGLASAIRKPVSVFVGDRERERRAESVKAES
jgi:exopolyphosphatase / guanosine-5'-triphosphate,3'-diphosphate pyrophosphatase